MSTLVHLAQILGVSVKYGGDMCLAQQYRRCSSGARCLVIHWCPRGAGRTDIETMLDELYA